MIGNGQIKMVEMVILVQYKKIKLHNEKKGGIVFVKWDKGRSGDYRWGIDTKFDLKIVDVSENFCNKNHGSVFFIGKQLVWCIFCK